MSCDGARLSCKTTGLPQSRLLQVVCRRADIIPATGLFRQAVRERLMFPIACGPTGCLGAELSVLTVSRKRVVSGVAGLKKLT